MSTHDDTGPDSRRPEDASSDSFDLPPLDFSESSLLRMCFAQRLDTFAHPGTCLNSEGQHVSAWATHPTPLAAARTVLGLLPEDAMTGLSLIRFPDGAICFEVVGPGRRSLRNGWVYADGTYALNHFVPTAEAPEAMLVPRTTDDRPSVVRPPHLWMQPVLPPVADPEALVAFLCLDLHQEPT